MVTLMVTHDGPPLVVTPLMATHTTDVHTTYGHTSDVRPWWSHT